MNPRDARRVPRWHPAAWRRRNGEESIRSGLTKRVHLLRKHSRTYVGYSIACAFVWAVILAAVWTQAGDGTQQTFAVFFGGWAIGWLSASIGRIVYPPPKPRRPA